MIHLAAAEPNDLQELAQLLAEMDTFYGDTNHDPLDIRIQQISEALFGAVPAAHALLARNDETLIGFATYSFLWPAAGLTRSLYLKELYVLEDQRRYGIGKQLMHGLLAVAAQHQCSRVEWTTDTGNQLAQSFYADLNAETNTGKLFYRVEGDPPTLAT